MNVSTPFPDELLKWGSFYQRKWQNYILKLLNEIVENCGGSLYGVKNEIDKICLLTNKEEIKRECISSETSFRVLEKGGADQLYWI